MNPFSSAAVAAMMSASSVRLLARMLRQKSLTHSNRNCFTR
jgi:hypothetical protein